MNSVKLLPNLLRCESAYPMFFLSPWITSTHFILAGIAIVSVAHLSSLAEAEFASAGSLKKLSINALISAVTIGLFALLGNWMSTDLSASEWWSDTVRFLALAKITTSVFFLIVCSRSIVAYIDKI